MSTFIRYLFGGSEQKSKSVPKDLTPPEFQGLRAPLAGAYGGLIDQPPEYPGRLTTQPTAGSTNLLGQAEAAGGGVGGDLLRQTVAGQFLPGQAGQNPFLTAAIEAAQGPTQRALEDTLSRTLPGTFAAAGHQIGGGLRAPPIAGPGGENARTGGRGPGSTAFDLAAARAFEGGAGALANIATNMSNAAYEAERGRQNQAIPLGQQEVQTFLANATGQTLPEMIDRLNVERGQAQFNQQIAQLLQILQLATGAAAPTVASETTAKGTSTGGLPALIGSFGPRSGVQTGGSGQ